MGSTPPRILLCGDVHGRLNQLFKRVQSVSKSAGPFDALLCVGQFFPSSSDEPEELSQYLDGRSQAPIPTYFTGDYGFGAAQTLSKVLRSPSNAGFKTDGIEIGRDLYWLRGSGRFSLRGLSIAYLSGKRGSSGSSVIGVYSEDDVGALLALSEDDGLVDIFLTNEWPIGVCNGVDVSNGAEDLSDLSGCDDIVAELVAEIKPRYHVAGTKNLFFARDPYLNDKAVHVTRFIGLGSVGNKRKEKFIHAISPTPASSMAPSEVSLKPSNTTLSPYTLTVKTANPPETKRLKSSDDDIQYWRYDTSQKRRKQGDINSGGLCFKFTSTGSCDRGEKCNFRHDEEARSHYLRNVCFDYMNKGKCERGPDCKFKHDFSEENGPERKQQLKSSAIRGHMEKKCWFCLSNPDVESHLLINVGVSYYCALAKGPLVPDHTLLIPIEHRPTSLAVPQEADIELGKLKTSLRMYFKKLNKEVIFYECVLPNNSHANIQAIPIPASRLSHVQRAFKLASERLGFQFATLGTNDLSDASQLLRAQFSSSSSFFYVELPDGSLLIHSEPDKEKFPIQFGREVLAGMLNMADRADWRNCKLNKEEEIKMVEAFKIGFEEFNPVR